MREQVLGTCKRIVVKIGSSLVASSKGGLHRDRIQRLTQELGALQSHNRQIIVVSSGAIVAGLSHLAMTSYPTELPLQQAAAAVGQSRLMQAYEIAFEKTNHKIAQVLLTHQDLADRRRFLNARHTLITLIQLGVIPIINENDTVAIDEIRFGDNDTLAGQVAHLVDANLLVILSDVNGLYREDPHLNPSAEFLSVEHYERDRRFRRNFSNTKQSWRHGHKNQSGEAGRAVWRPHPVAKWRNAESPRGSPTGKARRYLFCLRPIPLNES